MSLNAILNIGQQGIFASLKSLQTTSANIANVNTEGYSRQRAVYSPLANLTGVKVETVQRIRDEFLDTRRHEANNLLGFHSVQSQQINRLEGILDESSQEGINAAFSDFFRTWQDLTLNPGGATEREAVRSQGESLAFLLNSNYDRLQDEQNVSNNHIRILVTDANAMLREIGQLNEQIITNSAGDKSVNELLDQREVLLSQLQKIIPIHVVSSGESSEALGITVFSSSGMPLVLGKEVSQIEVVEDQFNNGFYQVWVRDSTGVRQEMTSSITSGEIGGALAMRDEIIPEQLRWIDELAAKFTTAFNLQHRAGMDLLGNTNIDFFAPVSVFASSTADNLGTGDIAGVVSDQALLTFNEYEIEFAAANSFDVIEIQADGSRVTLLAAQPYADPTTVSFAGIEVTIDGAPQAGDVFRVNTVDNAASNIELSPAIDNSLDSIAAGATANSGDNNNALALVALENSNIMPSATVSEFVAGKIADLGILTRKINNDMKTQEFIVGQLDNYISEISGVSLDEESANIIRFQRSYQAAAKIISSIDEVYASLLAILR
jgi:flagellar hook-associated protein 1 FlgK